MIFGNVSITGTHIGTVTNIDGEFSIKIKKDLNAKELEFNHVGYNTKTVALNTLDPEKM
ncbi:MAG: hypothetical protein HC831_01815 [Chloroflexia bacterium]|nr:hypothetical protein [Chloroflexia bacterium]